MKLHFLKSFMGFRGRSTKLCFDGGGVNGKGTMNRNREEFNHGGSVFLGKHRYFSHTDGGMDI
jgi:hypothetical protein